MLEVVTVWTPRPQSPQWRDYSELLALQARTVAHFGHRHRVVSDVALPGYDVLHAPLPESLMQALLAGPLAYFEQWTDDHPVVVMDMDCVVTRNLEQAFETSWDIGLTNRELERAPIQNGAMYFAPGARRAAIELFTRALGLCRHGWGGDQEAIAKAVEPVPLTAHPIEPRLGVRLAFLSTRLHNYSRKGEMAEWDPARFVVHFKGESKKWAAPFVALAESHWGA